MLETEVFCAGFRAGCGDSLCVAGTCMVCKLSRWSGGWFSDGEGNAGFFFVLSGVQRIIYHGVGGFDYSEGTAGRVSLALATRDGFSVACGLLEHCDECLCVCGRWLDAWAGVGSFGAIS